MEVVFGLLPSNLPSLPTLAVTFVLGMVVPLLVWAGVGLARRVRVKAPLNTQPPSGTPKHPKTPTQLPVLSPASTTSSSSSSSSQLTFSPDSVESQAVMSPDAPDGPSPTTAAPQAVRTPPARPPAIPGSGSLATPTPPPASNEDLQCFACESDLEELRVVVEATGGGAGDLAAMAERLGAVLMTMSKKLDDSMTGVFRRRNAQAVFCNSLVDHNGMKLLSDIAANDDYGPKVKRTAMELLERVIPLVWGS